MCTVLLTSNSGQACFFPQSQLFITGLPCSLSKTAHISSYVCSMAGSRLVQESVLGLDGI